MLLKKTFCCLLIIAFLFTYKAMAQKESKYEEEFTIENGAIPYNFCQNNEVLVFIIKSEGGHKGYNKYLKKAAEKNYHGEYIFAKSYEISSKYADREKYRYIFDFSLGTTKTSTLNTVTTVNNHDVFNSSTVSITAKRFYVRDRLTEEEYQTGGEFGNFYKAMQGYLRNLDRVREKNK